MARGSRQKQKLLYLQKIMLEKTDEKHGLTTEEIIRELDGYCISSERKSLYDDLKILEDFGLDICKVRTNTTKYYVGSRSFEIPELKLLVDAIQSSKFITEKKSLQLIKKLEGLVSENEGKQLQRQVYVINRGKTLNEKIYYNVDAIHSAIADNVQISFKYYKWDICFGGTEKIVKRERRDGLYTVSPWALRWDDENYYLIAYDSEAQKIKHYRVDKMDSIKALKDSRLGAEQFEKLDIPRYTNSVFSMFGGEETDVTLSVDNSLVGVIVDRFGKNVFVSKETDTSFRVSVKVMLSPQFFAWLFGLGNKIKILSPSTAVQEYKAMLEDISALY